MNNKNLFQYLRRNKSPYLFIAPFFIIYITFQMYPQIYSFILSFSEYKFGKKSNFIGLQNFSDALQDPVFWISLKNTAIFWISTLPVQLIVAIIIATLMTSLVSKTRGLLSGFYYLPVVTNVIAVVLVFQLMFDEKFGVFNYLLSLIGVGNVPWLTTPFWARFSLIMFITWRGLGYYIVYTLAGIMSVDKSLYEYAQTEGANRFQREFYITLPSIAPILLYQAFTGTIAGWNLFLEPFLLFNKGAGGLGGIIGPENSALTTSIYVYTEGFSNLKFGYGAAMSIMLAAVTTIFAVMQFKIFKTDNKGV